MDCVSVYALARYSAEMGDRSFRSPCVRSVGYSFNNAEAFANANVKKAHHRPLTPPIDVGGAYFLKLIPL